jgi:hypothetical protein
MRINIEADTLAEFDAIVAHFAGEQVATTVSRAEAPKEANKAPKETAPKEEKTASKTDVAEISYAKDIARRVLKLAEAKGRPAALEVLAKFGVEKAPQLKADQYPAFIAAVDTALDV